MPDLTPLPERPPDGRYRVLIVEDDPFIARLVLTNLNKANFHCRVATDGIDGAIEFRNFDPHLVLSDIMMPGIDGRQLCATIRELSMVPIILMTAADTSEAELAAFKAGADDYIPKPFDPRLLMTRVIAAMRRVYQYDVQAHAPASAAPQTGQIVNCMTCGYQGPHRQFRQENAKGERYLQCPQCREREHFSYRNAG
jgi:DNA-binding response OmpR family regulator